VERDANYTAVGAFVLLVSVMAGLFIYWYSEGRDRRSYERYEIYFPGSVTGLSEGSSVRYLGVEVGKVRRIQLDSRSPDRVKVIAELGDDAPITETTAANLSMLSFATGLLYIDLRQISSPADMMPAVPSQEYPVINTQRSGLDAFLGSLPELAGSIAELLENAKEILSAANAQKLSETVQNLHGASQGLPKTMSSADALLADMTKTSTEVRALVAGLGDTTGEISERVSLLVERLNATAKNLEDASASVQQLVADNREGVANFTQQGLPQLQRTLEAAQATADEIRGLTRSLKDNPSQLLYQGTPRGVEVPR
jgi:phospholipid/cholesterol/gamma-HCH transport system substrate-binding protein